jgi:hypothetical protein
MRWFKMSDRMSFVVLNLFSAGLCLQAYYFLVLKKGKNPLDEDRAKVPQVRTEYSKRMDQEIKQWLSVMQQKRTEKLPLDDPRRKD